MRVAWFSPVPPDPSGIAAYTREIVPRLQSAGCAVELYADVAAPSVLEPASAVHGQMPEPSERPTPILPARDFIARHRRDAYDLTVYQLGNATCHDYMWAFLYRYPGLLVLHDLQVHQARALWLLRRLEPRLDDYLAELRACHPGAPADLGHLVAAGLGGTLYRLWPMTALAIAASRTTVVHNAMLAGALGAAHPFASVVSMSMGVADPLAGGTDPEGPARLRAAHGIPAGAILVGAFGGITPEKRIPELLRAVAGLGSQHPAVHVLLAGQRAAHYDVDADVRSLGLDTRVHVAGWVEDADLPDAMRACDICANLRWPSNGETSASWLRCLAAGRPTIITALAHLGDVPAITGIGDDSVARVAGGGAGDETDAVTLAVDPWDEPAVLPAILARLCGDADLRRRIGANARQWWEAHHGLAQMAARYAVIMEEAARRPAPVVTLPAHLRDEGGATVQRVLAPFGLATPLPG